MSRTRSVYGPPAPNDLRVQQRRARAVKDEYAFFRSCGMPHVYTACHLAKVYGLEEVQVERIVQVWSPEKKVLA